MCFYHLKEGLEMNEKTKLEEFQIEVEQKQRRIYVLIRCKDPLDALDLAHACLHCLKNKDLEPTWKVLP
jgi:DNA-directed RNA polymerase alpha subunit